MSESEAMIERYWRYSLTRLFACFLRWKKVFDKLEIGGDEGGKKKMTTWVLEIMNSEDMVKLRALAELSSREVFNDPSLRVAVCRRILEVLVLGEGFGDGMKEAKQRGGKKKKGKKKKADARVVEVLDACFELGVACNQVRDFDDSECYYKRAKDGYEKELGRNDEKTLRATYLLIMSTGMSDEERIEKLRDLVARMKAALGEDNETTLDTLNTLGSELYGIGDYEEARKVYEKCLLGQEKVLGEDHKKTLGTVNNLGTVYDKMGNYEKALEYYERALKGYEKTLGKTHPNTLITVMNIAIVYNDGMKDYEKAEELYRRALEGYEAQLGKDHEESKRCAKNLAACLAKAGERKRLRKVLEEYPHIAAGMGRSIDELCR